MDKTLEMDEKLMKLGLVEVEETLRFCVYGIIDGAKETTEDEKELWDKVHRSLCELAKHYEAKGATVWKH